MGMRAGPIDSGGSQWGLEAVWNRCCVVPLTPAHARFQLSVLLLLQASPTSHMPK